MLLYSENNSISIIIRSREIINEAIKLDNNLKNKEYAFHSLVLPFY